MHVKVDGIRPEFYDLAKAIFTIRGRLDDAITGLFQPGFDDIAQSLFIVYHEDQGLARTGHCRRSPSGSGISTSVRNLPTVRKA